VETTASAVDRGFERARVGDPEGFAEWVRAVELPLRKSLRPFARRVDVEAIVQEGLLRMWVLAPRLGVQGPDASLRYATRLVRNLALKEIERGSRLDPVPPRDDDVAIQPDPPADRGLRRIITDCFSRLPRKPREALLARVSDGGDQPDRDLAAGLGMRLNTFLQNIVRARRHLATCLESHGVSPREYSS
jgi:RNA polymerase sigma-70 factor (ECF subfamily)